MKYILAFSIAVLTLFPPTAHAQSGACAASARDFAASLPGKKKQIIKVKPKGNRCLVVVRVKAPGKPDRVIRREIRK